MSGDRDELLAEVVLGLRREDDPPVREALAHADARARLADLRAVADELDAAAVRAEDVLAAARTISGAPGEDRVETVLRRLAAEEVASPARGGRRRRVLPLAVLAAAAALVAVVLIVRGGGAGDEPPRLLGVDDLELVAPGASFGGDVVFQWRGELAEREHFRVHVFDASDPLAFEPVRSSPETTERRWRPSDPDDLPTEIRWTVERLGDGDAPRGSSEAWSRRSR
jgi:hypothetical protein